MSEAMSSVEIEDVLSSIRRLVSEDLRPGTRTAPAKKSDEKLILTPAFRIVTQAPKSAEPTDRPTPMPRLHLGGEPEIERLAATLERAVEAQDIEWESEVGDPAPMVAAMEWTDADWSEPVAEPTPEPALATPSWAQDDPDQADDLDDAVLDTPIAEPDEYWADKAEAAAVAELRDVPADDGSLFAGDRAEVSFDEQVLRDLVRDMIREELQGGLGERITRNVRKLVRAEIARALAAQDFE